MDDRDVEENGPDEDCGTSRAQFIKWSLEQVVASIFIFFLQEERGDIVEDEDDEESSSQLISVMRSTVLETRETLVENIRPPSKPTLLRNEFLKVIHLLYLLGILRLPPRTSRSLLQRRPRRLFSLLL